MQWQKLIATTICSLGLVVANTATAQDISDKPLKIVVPFAAGGIADVLARALAEEMRPKFPKGVYVENKTGAGGNLGAAEVFNRSKPSENTLLISSPGPIAVNQGLYPKLPYDPSKWVAISTIASVPNALIVSPKLAVTSAQEFVQLAKRGKNTISYASQGNGTTSHLTAGLFESITGASMLHVPYKGDTPALTDLAGSQVDSFFGNVGAALNLHKAGKVRILAVADAKRSAALPDVPTFAEVGLPAMQSVTWYAAVSAPGTSTADITLLNRAVSDAVNRPSMHDRFVNLGLDAMPKTAVDSANFIKQQTQLWQKVIRDAHITIE
ncbi:tripartite tricarboxylate transporter substrate binding protein [Comamonas sp. w2-DMI]|uniref:Bug family tripartite tricarboxylate transporter substrate binding protein n=1 Tax=Comamonadaceae TaxID=80864 RepID=UPI0032D8BB13